MNGYPTGVGVSWSMQHGGPWPSTTSPSTTSVGAASIDRWMRPVTFQNVPDDLLPEALRDDNPLGIPQRVDGVFANAAVAAAPRARRRPDELRVDARSTTPSAPQRSSQFASIKYPSWVRTDSG